MTWVRTVRSLQGSRPRWRRNLAVTVAGAVVAVGVAFNVPAASAATVDPDAWYVLVARHSGKALDVYNRSTANGAPSRARMAVPSRAGSSCRPNAARV